MQGQSRGPSRSSVLVYDLAPGDSLDDLVSVVLLACEGLLEGVVLHLLGPVDELIQQRQKPERPHSYRKAIPENPTEARQRKTSETASTAKKEGTANDIPKQRQKAATRRMGASLSVQGLTDGCSFCCG